MLDLIEIAMLGLILFGQCRQGVWGELLDKICNGPVTRDGPPQGPTGPS